ncbi:MAG: 16S rRNA (adenine(1518)-N(6)/adenine(1519)-N(6))-dimethyltransferase RsmA [Patescibacteria group bacterium]|jgi:16S rRNA (adenine1518-N6/adenine1519-N6)-dimethyltransferase
MSILKETLDLCKIYNIHPQKSKGQNFLIQADVYDKIIAAADLRETDTVLEVGPGLGFLTLNMANRVKKVLAVELDKKIVEVLETIILSKGVKNIKLFTADILKARGSNFSKLGPYKVVSNLPYNISSVFLRKFLSLASKPELMVLMLQKEVVDRIMAQAPKMNLLALSVQFYAEVEKIMDVPADNFYPVPQVDSAVIKIIPNKKRLATYEEEKKFFKILRIGFSSKRKMLKNNLASALSLNLKDIEKILIELNLNSNIRAESLKISDWLKLYQYLK